MALKPLDQVPTQIIYIFVFNEPFSFFLSKVSFQHFAERAAHYSVLFLFVKPFFKLFFNLISSLTFLPEKTFRFLKSGCAL